jgi:hypothetical protein
MSLPTRAELGLDKPDIEPLDAAASVFISQNDFHETVERHGVKTALGYFNRQVSFWANRFTNVRYRRWVYVLGSCMNGETHEFTICQEALIKRYKKLHGRSIGPTTVWEYNKLLSSLGVYDVIYNQQGSEDEHPGAFRSTTYKVHFDRVLVDGQVLPHDFTQVNPLNASHSPTKSEDGGGDGSEDGGGDGGDSILFSNSSKNSSPHYSSHHHAGATAEDLKENSSGQNDDEALKLAEGLAEARGSWGVNSKQLAKSIRAVEQKHPIEDIFDTIGWWLGGYDGRWRLSHGFGISLDKEIPNPAGFLHTMLPKLVEAYLASEKEAAAELGVDLEDFDLYGHLLEQYEAAKEAAQAAEAEAGDAARAAAEAGERAAQEAARIAAIPRWYRYKQEPEDGIVYFTSSCNEQRGESRPDQSPEYKHYLWVNQDVHKILLERYCHGTRYKEFDVPTDEFWAIVKEHDPEAMAFRPQDNEEGNQDMEEPCAYV